MTLKSKNDKSPIIAELIGYNIVVFDIESSHTLYWNGFFGKPIGIKKPKNNFKRPLQLSFFEALYLLEKERIQIFSGKTIIDKDKLISLAVENYGAFVDEYLIYKYLRENGYVVRPGLKFGARFAVYEHGPGIDHAPFLVHVVSKRFKISAIDLLRAGRLATSVKKRFVIAMINERGNPEFFSFSWLKP